MNSTRFNPEWRTCCMCGDDFHVERAQLGYNTCLPCGDDVAVQARRSWTVAPMHKSNYLLITNPADLLGLNNKGGFHR